MVMIMNFVSALKAEIAQLEDELRSDPRQRKLARLRETLAEYEPSSGGYQAQLGSITISSFSAGSFTTLRTKGDRVKAAITALLRERGTVHRREILNHLKAVNLLGSEKNPMASLASYLSDWKDIFAFDGSGNWSLKSDMNSLKAAE
jgi:hypothetical protein